jgi:hypothetical protein
MAAQLSPEEAEEVVMQRIQEFGLGALPQVSVTETSQGKWIIRWEDHEREAQPMDAAAWKAWLERHVGSLDPDRLKTTEG